MVDRLRRVAARSRRCSARAASTYRVREAMDDGQDRPRLPGLRRHPRPADRQPAPLRPAARRARPSRARPAERRKPFWVFLDEVQSYDGAASGNLAALLEQSAKFGLRAVLLNQNPERLSPATLNALTTNRSHLLSSTLNSHAAALVDQGVGRASRARRR